MNNELAKTTEELAEIKDLVQKKTPTHRQAYSDRTCWIMACMSELAYVKFNPLLKGKQQALLLDKVTKALDSSKKNSAARLD
jgi:hypothetical protein